jgi:hypothetical protein
MISKFWECLVLGMLGRLLGATIILGAITGFVVELSEGAFFKTLGGQIVQGMLSVACFILVGLAFWRFGWKIGLLDLLLVIIGSNVGLALLRVRLPRP